MNNKKILMVAAENDALPGTKVGGVGDVLRDLPKALMRADCDVCCVLPSYGFLARLPKTEFVSLIETKFRGQVYSVELLKVGMPAGQPDIYVLHHPLFSEHGESVYCHDGAMRPFANDANKFALFCSALAEALHTKQIPQPDLIHCHDWHSAFLLILIEFSEEYAELKSIPTVYSIHNLAIQGIRPFRGDESSFESWYPHLKFEPGKISDPNLPHCLNPMRAGILLADRVHTVSPSYATEILGKSDNANGIYGGENLDLDLRHRNEAGELFGILNGCEYPRKKVEAPAKATLAKYMLKDVMTWAAKTAELKTVHWLAEKRVQQWAAKKKPEILITSVGRITDQKVRLLFVETSRGVCALEKMLKALGTKGTFVMLGSGDTSYEKKLMQVSAEYSNFIFLNGYSQKVGDYLYQAGDLFLMPSSFEPCGISQMLAMRSGQPCFVHAVGGLKDTITQNVNGFCFEGKDLIQQADAMTKIFSEVIKVKLYSPEIWEGIQNKAKKTRFTWEKSAQEYLEKLYQF